MKKIIILLIMLQNYAIQAYTITNASESNIPVVVVVTKKKEMGRLKLFNIQAEYDLKPGQQETWHKDAIWRQLNQHTITVRVYNKGANIWKSAPLIVIEKMPINAVLEIYAVKDDTGYKAAAIDYMGREAYNNNDEFLLQFIDSIERKNESLVR